MKDKDFDDIGKRLYDLEADPPKKGWKKIGYALRTPQPAGKMVWLRKNWWKPLIILVPVGLYLMYSAEKGIDITKSSSVEGSSVERSSEPPKDQDPSDAGAEPSLANSEPLADDKSDKSVSRQPIEDQTAAFKDDADDSSGPTRPDISLNTKDSVKSIQKPDLQNAKAINNTTATRPKETITGEKNLGEANERADIAAKTKKTEITAKPNVDSDISRTGADNVSNDRPEREIPLPAPDSGNQQVSPTVTDAPGARHVKSIIMDSVKSEDSAAATPLEGIAVPSDSVRKDDAENQASERFSGKWRITLSFSPQFISRTVQPVAGDEVLMTGIDRSRDSRKVGFTLAAGAGLAITENFYLDAQVSYAEAEQEIYFSYATGNVDTLIAVKQPDQSVRVTPIYETADREIASKYGYAGIRIGATHYFWSTQRRRFNISAMGGANYLVSADVREKRNGNWVELRNNDLNKINYTLMVSAGYNINLNKGWEIMINPSLTYYLRKVKNSELPYHLNQQSLGLNFMLSKTLGRK